MAKEQPNVVEAFTVNSFGAQTVFPGVQSNLTSTTNYILDINLSLSDEVSLKSVHTNGVVLPVKYAISGGKRISVNQDKIAGLNKNYILHFGKNNYNDVGDKVVTQDAYETSPKDTAEKAFLELQFNESSVFVELPLPEIKDPIYAP